MAALTPPSTPPSPALPTPHVSSNLDDIFGSQSPSPSQTSHSPTNLLSQHPTDIKRLRSTHTTAGYRDGISVSKDPAVQPGFDEGYPLGATFGLRVGYLLGVLEGIIATYGAKEEGKRVKELSQQARVELSVEKVFGEGAWKSDGTWGYEVPGEEGEITWKEVVNAHPVVRKWNGVVEEEMLRLGIQGRRFEGAEWEAGRVSDDGGG